MLIWVQTFLITHREATPARALTNLDIIPKISPKVSRLGGELLAIAGFGVEGTGAIIG